jgi:hypothetical protein
LGIGDWAQSPIPNPQSPIPNPHFKINLNVLNIDITIKKNYKNKKIIIIRTIII